MNRLGHVLLTTAALLHAWAGDTWPQWRGPTRDGRFVGSPWPADLKADHLSVAWHADLGPGYSGPIVTSNRVFTTETRDRKFEVVRAFDRASGTPVWTREWEGAMSVPFFAKSNGDWIRATPAYAEGMLYVAGMRDVLVALDAGTGEIRWRKDFVAELKSPLPAFGFVSSPLVDGDAVYVQAGGGVVRLDRMTGAVRWRALASDDAMMGSAFSSPVIASPAGRRQLVVQTRAELAGLDLENGSVLWRQPIEAMRGMNILTPVVEGSRLFTSAYGGKTLAFDLEAGSDGALHLKPAWEFKSQGYMTTPVVIDGRVYFHLRSQRIQCLDLATGAELWTSGEGFGKYWSLVAHGERMLALDERGDLLLIRADPAKLEVQDRRRIAPKEAWAHLAVVDGQVVIRDLASVTVWNWRSTP